MTFKKLRPVIGLLAVVAFAGAGLLVFSEKNDPGFDTTLGPDNEACTVIMVGKAASTDGSTMTTHTADCGTCDWTSGIFRRPIISPARPGKSTTSASTRPGKEATKWPYAMSQGETGFSIPQVPHTYAFHHGMFGYMNENQVAISESTLGTVRKLVNNTPSAKLDLTMLSRLGMERSRTARECIEIMGSLAETYGYGFNDDGEMFAVSDPDEVWIFEIMPVGPLWSPETGKPGAVWCAQRLPDDHVSVCPNESRIGEVNLEDKENFMGSAHMVSFAVAQKLYDTASGKPFNWKRAYSPAEGGAVSTNGRRSRLWRFLDLVAPSRLDPNTPNMDLPFSVKPDHKLSVQDRESDPGQELRLDLRSGGRHPRRPVQESPLLRRHPEDLGGQRRIHEPGPVPKRVSVGHRGDPLGGLRSPGHVLLHPPVRRNDGPPQVVPGR